MIATPAQRNRLMQKLKDLSRRCQSQYIEFRGWSQLDADPQPGLGPGVGAQFASQQRLIFRSGRS
jgi:hypothetical protein